MKIVIGVLLLLFLTVGAYSIFRHFTSLDEEVTESLPGTAPAIRNALDPEQEVNASPGTAVMTDTSSAPAEYQGRYETTTIGTGGINRTLTLILNSDNTVTMTERNPNNQVSVEQSGIWSIDPSGYLVVTLTHTNNQQSASPDVLLFRKDGAKLVAVTYEEELWGPDGLVLTQV